MCIINDDETINVRKEQLFDEKKKMLEEGKGKQKKNEMIKKL